MKSKKSKSKLDPGTDQDEKFPGYPKYDPREDITRNSKRVEGNLEDDGLAGRQEKPTPSKKDASDDVRSPGGKDEFDVTNEDLEALGPKDLSMDMGEDEELLKHRNRPVDFAGSDLDVPGSELDDAEEEIGSEDEENNPYSLGGDSKENLEERND